MRFLLCLWLSCFCFETNLQAQTEKIHSLEAPGFPFIGLVTGDSVNLRAGPGRSYEILSELPKGSKVRVIGQRGAWYSVQLPEGVPAYLHRNFVRLEEDWAQVRGERVHVRANPSPASTSWGTLRFPERVQVLGQQGEWLKIQPPSFCRGWVHRDYVLFLEGVQDDQH